MHETFDILRMKQQICIYDFHKRFVNQEMQFLLRFEVSMQCVVKRNDRLEAFSLSSDYCKLPSISQYVAGPNVVHVISSKVIKILHSFSLFLFCTSLLFIAKATTKVTAYRGNFNSYRITYRYLKSVYHFMVALKAQIFP